MHPLKNNFNSDGDKKNEKNEEKKVHRSRYLEGYAKNVSKTRKLCKKKRKQKKKDPRLALPETFSPRGWAETSVSSERGSAVHADHKREEKTAASEVNSKKESKSRHRIYRATFDHVQSFESDYFGYKDFHRKYPPRRTQAAPKVITSPLRPKQESMSMAELNFGNTGRSEKRSSDSKRSPPGPKWGRDANYESHRVPKSLSEKSAFLKPLTAPSKKIVIDQSCYSARLATRSRRHDVTLFRDAKSIEGLPAEAQVASSAVSHDHVGNFVRPLFKRKRSTEHKLRAMLTRSDKLKGAISR